LGGEDCDFVILSPGDSVGIFIKKIKILDIAIAKWGLMKSPGGVLGIEKVNRGAE